jgi:drug/metabolite transporter (DMT)-like permease
MSPRDLAEGELSSEKTHGERLRDVAIPFVIFTLIWGSTWIVIRGQLGSVPPQWSVAYRFIIATAAMAMVARWKGESLGLGSKAVLPAIVLGFCQFCVNFNAVYLAERHITSGVVATVFALLLIPASLMAWAFLGQRPTRRFAWSSLVAVSGVLLLFVHELRGHAATSRQIVSGIALTFVGMLGASIANVLQARPEVRRFPLFAMLVWSMGVGAIIDILAAFAFAGAPTLDSSLTYWAGLLYLALAASVLNFSLYYPVVRKIGPGKAAYSSVLVPIIAMGFSTWLENYRWTSLTVAGAILALGGMVAALSRGRTKIAPPDAA